jgi:hypothetical protein
MKLRFVEIFWEIVNPIILDNAKIQITKWTIEQFNNQPTVMLFN